MDPIRRKILKTGAASTMMAAAPRALAQQRRQRGSFYEKGRVRIYYEETRVRLSVAAHRRWGAELDDCRAYQSLQRDRGVQDEYRCIASDLRNAN